MCVHTHTHTHTHSGSSLKLFDKSTYLGSSISTTGTDIGTRLTKAWTTIHRLSVIWKADLTNQLEQRFFQAAVVSILQYACITWTLIKRMEKKLDGNYTRMLWAILNKSWKQHPTKLQLYGHLPPIMKTIKVRRTRYAGHCWRSRDKLISDALLWTLSHGRANAGQPSRTYIQQLCEDTGRSPEDLSEAMKDMEEWRERIRDIHAVCTDGWMMELSIPIFFYGKALLKLEDIDRFNAQLFFSIKFQWYILQDILLNDTMWWQRMKKKELTNRERERESVEKRTKVDRYFLVSPICSHWLYINVI